MVYMFFDKKTRSGAIVTSTSEINVNEQLAEELHKPVIKKFKRKKTMRDLKTIFGHRFQLKWDHCLPSIKMLNLYYV